MRCFAIDTVTEQSFLPLSNYKVDVWHDMLALDSDNHCLKTFNEYCIQESIDVS